MNVSVLDRFRVIRSEMARTIGKTVRFRRGAAAVIGQASELPLPLWPVKRRAWEGRSEAVTSRKPEDLPAECLFRCFGREHSSRRERSPIAPDLSAWAEANRFCPCRQKGLCFPVCTFTPPF